VDGRYWLGIDIGGTFTDFSLFDPVEGTLTGLKVPSTPPDFAEAVDQGLARLRDEHGVDPQALALVVHGTTIAVNTIIQRTGARLGLLVTEGFRDLLEIQRLRLPNPFDLNSRRPAPLVERARVAEVRERVLVDGRVDTPLDEASAEAAIRRLDGLGAEGLVVAFLHAYRNPAHEARARAIAAAAAPRLPVSTSAEVWPQAREYERTTLAVMDAYVQPKVRRYLDRFQAVLRAHGVPAVPYVTKSNGGLMPVGAASRRTVLTLLSGPASGVIGAAHVAAQAGIRNLITLDVGGTSADIAIVEAGRPRYSTAEHIGDFPVIMPVVGVSSIGAGGGSVAWVDEVGVPKVGPQSTGSVPGPAAYGQGGKDATLTDAFLVSGFLDPDHFLGGRMRLDRGAAEEALGRFADAAGLGLAEAAESVIRVAVSTMYAESTKIMSRHAVDPREFALVAFGGAGPLVACLIAREVGIPLVFVPRAPGTLCALGAITTDILQDGVRTVHLPVRGADLDALGGQYRTLEAEHRAWLAAHGLAPGTVSFRYSADMRYVGQSYEIEVEAAPAWLAAGGETPLLAAFHRGHERMYGHADPRAAAEIVNIRVQMRGAMPKVTLREAPPGTGTPEPRGTRPVRLDGRPVEARVYARDALGRDDTLRGPAIVEQADTTVLLPPGFAGTVDRHGNLWLRRDG
jgi:N-methylhydantoinase A